MEIYKEFWFQALSVLVIIIGFASQAQAQFSINIMNKGSYMAVTLENQFYRVRYDRHSRHADQVYVVEYFIKSVGRSQGDWIDAAAHRALLKKAEMVYNGSDKKTVRMTWVGNASFPDSTITEITIFPDKSYIQYDHLQFGFPHIVDLGAPGGVRTQNHPDLVYEMYGAAEWQALRKTVTDPDLLNHESKDHRLTYDLYPIYEFPIIDTPDWKGLSPDPMNFNGFLIMGAYNKRNNEGFGRVVSFEEISYLKLLWHYGFELFPFWKGQPARRRFRGYLFPITKGAGEAITVGKQLAMLPKPDNAHPDLDTAYVTGSTGMKVVFNEPVTKESAEDTANYHVSRGMNVLSASLQADQKTVLLTTTPLLNNTNYKLSIYNIVDLSENTADYLWTYTPTNATFINSCYGFAPGPAPAVDPNPVQQGQKATFTLPLGNAAQLNVYDAAGTPVQAIGRNGKGFSWDTGLVAEGVYYYRTKNSAGKLIVIE